MNYGLVEVFAFLFLMVALTEHTKPSKRSILIGAIIYVVTNLNLSGVQVA